MKRIPAMATRYPYFLFSYVFLAFVVSYRVVAIRERMVGSA